MTPRSNRDAEWNAACLRLEDYLRSHSLQDRAMVLRLTLRILEEARAEQDHDPTRSPVERTMQIATDRAEAWFANLASGHASDPQSAARGRVAYFASGAYRAWPAVFLDPNPPPEFINAVRQASVQAGPDLEFTSLIRAEVDYGPMESIARETWEKFSWSHVFRAFALWAVIFFAAWYAYLRYFQ